MEFRVPATDKPTFFNKDTALGALIGGTLTLGPWGAGIGAAIGGYLGKNRMEKEAQEGKIVKPPSFWNKDTAIGGLIGNLAGGAVGSVLAVATVLVLPHAALLAAGLLVASVATGIGIGIMKGGENGRARMDREYTEAAAQSQGVSPSIARSQQRGPAPAVEYDVPAGSRVADLQRRSDPATAQYLSGRSPS